MKKLLFILFIVLLSSCSTPEKSEVYFTVYFKNGNELAIKGIDADATKNAFIVYHSNYVTSVFNKDEVLYIIKED